MTAEQWADRWQVLVPPGTAKVDVAGDRRGRREQIRSLAWMGPGDLVVLRDPARGSRARCRRLVRAAGLRRQRELIALPSLERSAFLVEDDVSSVRFAWTGLITVPPGISRGHACMTVVLGVCSRLPWQVLGAVAPGRVVIAVKP